MCCPHTLLCAADRALADLADRPAGGLGEDGEGDGREPGGREAPGRGRAVNNKLLLLVFRSVFVGYPLGL